MMKIFSFCYVSIFIYSKHYAILNEHSSDGYSNKKIKKEKSSSKPGIYLISRAINKVSNSIITSSPNFHLHPLVFIGYISCTCLLYIKY